MEKNNSESNKSKRVSLLSKLMIIESKIREAKNNIAREMSISVNIENFKQLNELNKVEEAIKNIRDYNRYNVNIENLKCLAEILNIDLHELDELKVANEKLKGIIMAGGTGTRLYPITGATSKQLIPVYDKPMIYYPLSVLMEANIKDILIITTKEDQPNFKRLLLDGSQFGVNISYIIQPSPDGLAQAFILGEDFIENNPCAMVLGDNIYYGNGFKAELQKATTNAINGYATIFGYKVRDPERFGIMEMDDKGNVLSVEEKPKMPKSDYAITGLYFYPTGVSEIAKHIKPSDRNELEITSLNDHYLQEKRLKASLLGDGFTWFDTGTFDSLLDASNMIRTIENNKDTIVCCPEMIAYNNGWMSKEEVMAIGNLLSKNSYGKHLIRKMERERR